MTMKFNAPVLEPTHVAEASTRVLHETFLSSPDQGPLSPPLAAETRLERFTIIRHLGSGRTAHVYLARDEVQSNEVALKVARLPHDQNISNDQSAARELALWRRVGGHPNILTLFDVHHVRVAGLDLVLLSMEHADGYDLRAWLARNREKKTLCVDEAISIVIAVASGLATLHRAGVIHFDVKPENIFCVNGTWKIGDLDQALQISDVERTSSEGETNPIAGIRGTPGYRSPELEGTACGMADERSDIFALGLVLREVLGLDRRSSVLRHPPTESLIRARLERIIRRCLSPDPNQRYQVLEHFIEALELARRGERVRKGDGAVYEQQARWRRILRCLNASRGDDAARLSRVLLEASPHHSGARAVISAVQRQNENAVSGAGELNESLAGLSLDDAIKRIRPIVAISPHHEEVIKLVAAVESRANDCRNALHEGIAMLQAGDAAGANGALRRCYVHDSHVFAAEACATAGDWAQRLDSSRRRIEAAVAKRRYSNASELVKRHEQLLNTITAHADRICLDLDGAPCVEEPTGQ